MSINDYSPEALAEILDGCSGGLSAFYRIMWNRDISCIYCCDEHDVAYFEGGTSADRKLADRRLRECAASAGRFTGWRAPLRRAWRWFRAWIMYAAVRVFGGRKRKGDELRR